MHDLRTIVDRNMAAAAREFGDRIVRILRLARWVDSIGPAGAVVLERLRLRMHALSKALMNLN